MRKQEGVEAVVDEMPSKSGPSRSSSKRCRAAEVHNLSEKVFFLFSFSSKFFNSDTVRLLFEIHVILVMTEEEK